MKVEVCLLKSGCHLGILTSFTKHSESENGKVSNEVRLESKVSVLAGFECNFTKRDDVRFMIFTICLFVKVDENAEWSDTRPLTKLFNKK